MPSFSHPEEGLDNGEQGATIGSVNRLVKCKMGKYIVKLDNFYFEWSEIVDAPVTFGMSIEEFTQYYKEEYGASGSQGLAARLERVEKKGVSAHDYESVKSLLSFNCAGPKETHLPINKIRQAFCNRIPIVVKGYKWNPVDGEWILCNENP